MYNIVFGFAGQIITLALGIVIPRLFIINLGSAANGLLSSIGQVLAYLTLLEAGLGGASIQALYRPLAGNDKKSINSILSATSAYYKKTGRFYLLCVIAVSLLYPLVVKDFSYGLTCAVVLLSGVPGVLNYYYQGKFRVLLQAEGKSYIIANIATIIGIVSSVVKIALLTAGCNLIELQVAFCLVSLVPILIYHLLFVRKYKWVDFAAAPDFKALSQKGSVFIHQIASLVLTNSAVILLTLFSNLKVVSVFIVYNMVFDIVTTSTQMAGNSVSYLFGRAYHTDRNLFLRMFDSYESLFFSASFSLFTIAYLFILPFLKLYTAGVTDINYLDPKLPLLFVIFKLLAAARTPCLNIINVVGRFRETQNSAIIEAALSVIVSLVAVIHYGIYGVLIGNIAALLYRAVYLIVFTNEKIMNRTASGTVATWGVNVLCSFLIVYTVNARFPLNIGSYKEFFLQACAYGAVISLLFLAVGMIVNTALSGSILCLIKQKFYKC